MDSSPHIPSAIGNLSSLTHLNLSNSNFVGEIPRELSNITTLVSLDLSSYGNNYLVMKLQSLEGLVRHMINLKELHLSFVNLPSSSSSSSSGVSDLLSNFSSLESLRLDGCELQGDFPVAIFDLSKLKMLDISLNPHLKGYLPNFRLGSPLKSLRLYGTSFGGALPPSIGNLASMDQLEISNCNFTGKLPMSLGNLTRIATFGEAMIWEGNHFSPDSLTTTSLSWIGKLTKLTGLDFRDMSLMGEIPSWLMNLTQLTYLYMDRNRLTGPIPSWLMSLPQLVRIDLSHNQLTGQLPSQFSHLIEELDVSYNNLEGLLPTNLSTLNNLYDLSLMSNRLVGSLELSLFSRLKSLYSLGLSYNNLSLSVKNISTENVAPFPNLTFLDLASCNVSEFPTFLHTNKNNTVFHLDLSGNSITGQIPSWVFDLGQNLHGNGINLYLSHNLLTGFERQHPLFHPRGLIRTLDLRHNMLQGSLPIPPAPSIYTLESYLISNNYLSGEVSNLICSFRDIWLLDLSFNRFSGKLPQCLSNFSQSLSSLDLKGNKFEGNIPSSWGNGCQLKMISTSHNQLQGQLPRSLANCSSLEFVDFGNNKITDTFPSWLGTITSLSVLILRSNRLHGAIEDDLGSSDGFSNLRVFDLSNNNFRGNLPSEFINMANPMRAFNASRKMEYMTAYLHTSQEVNSFNYSMTMNVKGSDLNYPMIPDIFVP
ncbi:unnamed protein product [Cuscuta campestris]|uniref:Leucine-rich repeat-containing N-terminal plant-type domain-containing protein n=1 Tax=Cuscuta campestris TaxID=132261 RepID=A0A484LBG7_9ASTE|nr:unnamed protein product [Cuscuta campestris]